VEDHYTVGGLGSLLAENMATLGSTMKLLRIGVEDFGQSGSPEANFDHYGLTANKISLRIFQALSALKSS
jgi:transketolase C-terminal domain/subunit